MEPKSPWKKLSSEVKYENPWLKIREDKVIRPDGKEGIYGVMETKHSVFLVAAEKDKSFYLVNLYRYPTAMWSWELPAGGTDGDEPLIAAKRELAEELGLTAQNWQKLGELQAMNGLADEIMHVFLATELTLTGNHKRADEGITEVKKVTAQQFEAMIASSEMTCGQSMASYLLARPYVI